MQTPKRLGQVFCCCVIFIGALLHVRSARADAETCTTQHASGQRAMKAGELKAAMTMFNDCGADEACPAPIRNECMELFSAAQGKIPTVVFSVTDSSGNDVTDVRVFRGEELVADGLDGRPVPIDPGKHEFRFELPSGEAIMTEVLVRQSEKDRIVTVSAQPSVSLPDQTPSRETTLEPFEEEKSDEVSIPAGFWVATGIGAAALGSWGVFGLMGRSKHVSLVDCSPNCSPSRHDDYDAMKRNYLIADVSLGIALASAGVATVILLTADDDARSDEQVASAKPPAIAVTPVALGNRGGLLLIESSY